MKKLIIIAIVVVLILFGIFKLFDKSKYQFEQINLNQYEKLNHEKETVLLYVYDKNQKDVLKYTEIIKTNLTDKKIKTYALDYSNFNENEKTKMKNANEATKNLDIEQYKTALPMLVLMKNGMVIGSINGVYTNKEIKEFIERNKVK